LVEEFQGDLRLGPEGETFGDLGLVAAVGVVGPVLGQVESGGDGPGEGAFGVVAVDGDLTIAGLAQGAGVLAGDADGTVTLLGEAGVVEDQDAVALGGQPEHDLDALAVEVVLVPVDGGEESLETLLGGSGDDLGDGVTVLVGMFGEQPGEIAFEGLSPLAPLELDAERREELGQFGQRSAGSVRNSVGVHDHSTDRNEPKFR